MVERVECSDGLTPNVRWMGRQIRNQLQRRWFTAAETAAYFGLSAKTLYSLAARGRPPGGAVLRLGRQLRFDITAIEQGSKLLGVSNGFPSDPVNNDI